ncbi:MAG: AAC(3) family N-acetyltransferase [Ileibacterium sp.]|nr:AAC(3) family N-acetyltransferase [Ileibacterium sp.]
MEHRALTRKDVKALLESIGIEPGSTVLLQADVSNAPWMVGGINALIETLMEMLTPKGLLILPTFTKGALDPACDRDSVFDMPQWPVVRSSHPGFSSRTMPADVYEQAAQSFLLHTRVKRSEHPVYSVAWWGTSGISPSMETLNYPLSFRHILKRMEDERAINLLVGVDLMEALYPVLLAHQENEDTTVVENAFVRRTKRTFEEPFLHSVLSEKQTAAKLKTLDIISRDLGGLPVYKIMQPVSFSMNFEMSSSKD